MPRKPVVLDLYCGMGGWPRGMVPAGWDCVGVDIRDWGYPCRLILQDVRELARNIGTTWQVIESLGISLVVASPPCTEFSYRHLPYGRVKNLPPPDLSMWWAGERIAERLKVPIIIENVIGAQKWVGKAKMHYGPYYLWGDIEKGKAVWGHPLRGKPPVKGFGNLRETHIGRRFSSKSIARQEFGMRAAMIPYELAYWIGYIFHPTRKAAKITKSNPEKIEVSRRLF